MKKFLVVLLACVMIFGFATTALAADTQIKEFSDIADQSQAAKNAIMKLAVLGVIEGNEGIGGAYRPADNLTRAEFAKIVCYLTDNVRVAESLTSVGSKFSDVSTGNWYTGWVNAAAQSGYFVGDPGGTFRPNANITMQEVVTVSLRAAGYTDKLGSATGNTTWPANYVSKAMSIGVLDDVTFVGSAAATRADMAIICNEVLGINMVVHINNDIAYALALSDGTVDPDGFSEVYYISNETKREKIEETILHKAFDGQYYYLQVSAADLRDRTTNLTVPDPSFFDESNGWSYEDYDDSEIYINLQDQYCYEDDDFDEYVYTTSSGNTRYSYGNAESLASTYYITGGNQLSDLSGMQVQVIVIDDKEINFVNVYSSTVQAQSVYKNSNSNIVADGKTYRASSTMDVSGKVNSAAGVSGGVADLSEGATFGADSNGDPNGIQNLYNSSSDDDFPAKLYLDKEGRVYATKNYNAYNDLPFGIVDEVDSGEVVLKAQANDWKTSGSAGGSTNYTLDTDEPYVLIKDGEMIKADDLAENDVITYLGDNGAHFYYVSSPVEGEFTQQTSSKITVAGFGYRQVTEFHISDDGGEDFEVYNGFSADPIDSASFGDSEIAIAYNFSRIDYIALNTASSKIIGVVTNADPDSVWDTASGFLPQYKSLTIYNSEGKEVKYTFTTNFRNAYNSYLDSNNWVKTDYSSTSSATGKFYSDYFSSDKTLEVLSREIQEGDIVQVTLDNSDNIKKLANYVAFDGDAADDKVEATVKSSNNRITITKNTLAKENGTYTLPSDATVFNVTSDGGDYDDVTIKTVASTLSADFKAAKIVAFDTKSNGNVNYLYILEGVSAYKFGIISGQGRDATDDYYTMNGKRVYNDGTRVSNIPNLVTYNISGGDAVVADRLAWRVSANEIHYVADMATVVNNRDSDYGAVVGTVTSYSSSTNALNVGGQMLYITSDSFLYDFPLDDTVSSASGLRDKFVAVIYDDDFEVICVALLADSASSTKLVAHRSGAATEQQVVDNAVVAINAALVAGEIVVPAGADATDLAVVKAAVDAILANAGITGVTVTVEANADGTFAVKLTVGESTATVNAGAVEGTLSSAAIITTVDGKTVTWSAAAGTLAAPKTATIAMAADTIRFTAADLELSAGATVTLHATSFATAAVNSVNVPGTVYLIVTAQDGTTVVYYALTVQVAASNAITAVNTILGQAIGAAAGSGTYRAPSTGTATIANAYATQIVASNIVTTEPSATVQLYSNDTFYATATSITLPEGDTDVCFTVESSDGSKLEYYIVTVTRTGVVRVADLDATDYDASNNALEAGGTFASGDEPVVTAVANVYTVGALTLNPAFGGGVVFPTANSFTAAYTLTAAAGTSFTGTDITPATLAALFPLASNIAVIAPAGGATLTITLTYALEPIVLASADLGTLTQAGTAPMNGTAVAGYTLPAVAASAGMHSASVGTWVSGVSAGNFITGNGSIAEYKLTLTASAGYTFDGSTIDETDFAGLEDTGVVVTSVTCSGKTCEILVTITLQ